MSSKKRKKAAVSAKHTPKSIVNNEISKTKKYIFWGLTILLPFIILVLFEVILRLINYGENIKLFTDNLDKVQKIYLNINQDIGKRYFSYTDFVPAPRINLFLKQKPAECYRIFIMGGSTTAGFPYGNNLDFGKILNRKLADTFPDKKIEVINTAMTAVNSYTVWDFMDEIIEQKPDAILIYCGHNEFYGAFGVASMESFSKYPVFVKAFLRLQRFKSFLFLKDIITYFRKKIFGTKNIKNLRKNETTMSKLAKDQLVKFNSRDYELGKEQFRDNLSDIIEIARDHDIKVILSQLVSNIKDQQPFSKESGALEIYKEAEKAEREADFLKAKELYYKAKDYDAIRFRAPEDFNTIIHEIANSNKIPMVPMKYYFENASSNGLIGKNLMIDHLHPNKKGYFLMADAFYNTMKENKLIAKNWPTIKKDYLKSWGFTELDSVFAQMTIIQMMGDWPFVQSGKGNDALAKMPRLNYIDSLAYNLHLHENLTLQWGHITLGKYYEQNGEYIKALKEYIVLTYQMPNVDVFYEPALNLLSKTENYKYATILLMDAMKYHKSGLIYCWIGQFSAEDGNYEQARKYLELGIRYFPKNILVLYYLAVSYYELKLIDEGDQIMRSLESINPSLNQIAELKKIRNSITSVSK